MKSNNIVAFAISAITAGICVAPAEADAVQLRVAATTCRSTLRPGLSYITANTAYIQNSGSSTETVICGYGDDTDLAHWSVTQLDVFVYDSSSTGTVKAKACASDYDSTGAACSTEDATTGTGYDTLHPDLAVWQNAFTYGSYRAYVTVDVNGGDMVTGITAQ